MEVKVVLTVDGEDSILYLKKFVEGYDRKYAIEDAKWITVATLNTMMEACGKAG